MINTTARLKISLTTLALILGASQLVYAAPRLSPPSAALLKGHHQIVVGTVSEAHPPNRMTFNVQNVLFGDPVESVQVRISPEQLESVILNEETYVLGFTRIRRNPLIRDIREIDPDGPKTLEIPYLGTALVPTSKALQGLLVKPGSTSTKAALKHITELLNSPEPLHRRFASAELQLRPELFDAVRKETARAVRARLEEDTFDPDLRDLLLQANQRFPKKYRGSWMADVGSNILAAHGPELDLTSHVPALVQTALAVVEDYGTAKHAETAIKHLGSNNPGVVKAALKTSSKLKSDKILPAVQAALQPVDLHSESRRVLQQYLDEHKPAAKSGD